MGSLLRSSDPWIIVLTSVCRSDVDCSRDSDHENRDGLVSLPDETNDAADCCGHRIDHGNDRAGARSDHVLYRVGVQSDRGCHRVVRDAAGRGRTHSRAAIKQP